MRLRASARNNYHTRPQRRQGFKFDMMHENEISKIVVNTCYNIHVELGPGLLKSV